MIKGKAKIDQGRIKVEPSHIEVVAGESEAEEAGQAKVRTQSQKPILNRFAEARRVDWKLDHVLNFTNLQVTAIKINYG